MLKKILLTLSLSVFILNYSQAQHEESHAAQHGDEPLATVVSEEEYEEHHNGAHEPEEFNMGQMIMHHIVDEHGWEFTHSVKLPLPVILYSKEKGLEVFSSADFDANNGKFGGYLMEHNHIAMLDANGEPNHEAKVYDFSITKNTASLFVSAVLLLVVFLLIGKSYKTNGVSAPKGLLQSMFEPIIIFIRDEVAEPNIGPKYTRFMPYLLTLFFFILFNNLLGLFPGGANLTGNISITLTLALITFIVVHFNAKKPYWMHLIAPPGVPVVMYPLFWIIEFIGVLMKPASLCIRLFANITGGHIIILSLLGLIFVFQSYVIGVGMGAFTLFMSGIELMVAFIQAFIFTLLSAMYIGTAVEEAHDH